MGPRLGLDIGALAVHAVLIDDDATLLAQESAPHHGEVLVATRELLQRLLGDRRPARLGLVGSQAEPVARALGIAVSDEAGATLRGAAAVLPGVRQVIDAGGASLSLLRLKEDGSFAGYQSNTLCAAGTGSFLDEQAERLGIRHQDMAALPVVEDPPDIAARCAVFAKSDLIHRQQEGYGKAEMWAGLCRGLARTMLMTLFKGRAPEPPVALVGGVALNPEVVRALRAELGVELWVPECPESCTALGAALGASELAAPISLGELASPAENGEAAARRPALVLSRSDYPSFQVQEEWIDEHGTELRISRWPADGQLRGTLGVDIGSTSTKAVLMDEQERILLDLYRKTAGDPIGATKLLLAALRQLAQHRGAQLEITGAGTTGSGRKLVGAVIGADRVANEITAHVTGAMAVDAEIDTIFEIGGQDAKYIHAVDGRLHDANMNYVCAAGTGSFVEELSRKLGFELHTLGERLLGVEPPVTSDRCTVFMEQDARHLLRKGFTPREVMGAVVYSVVQNYLSKVVGHRPRSRQRVFFQGATARNQALVAAFENLLDVEVVVSPYAHVMGSWGVAMLTRRQQLETGSVSSFVGVEFADARVRLSSSVCELCTNRCAITHAEVQGLQERPSWGYLCGREPEEARVRPNRAFAAFRARDRIWRQAGRTALPKDAPRVFMPRALLGFSYTPFWRRFFGALGFRLQLSRPTDPEVVRGASDWVGADYCFPVKLAHGHLRALREELGPDALLFVPYMISAQEQSKTQGSWFCPYNIGLPAMLEAAAELRGQPLKRLLKPTVDLRWDAGRAARRLRPELGSQLGAGRRQLREAWTLALGAQRDYEEQLAELGRRSLAELEESGQPAVVVLGRPYNVYDAGANLALPEKIARLGLTALPMELLPLDEEPVAAEFSNMFWNFGRHILEAASYVARSPRLYAVGFTNFSCGPDSFIWTYVERIMGRKPMLVLELDEHGADAGYLTRLEAFSDVIAANPNATAPSFQLRSRQANGRDLKGSTLWIPPMHEASPTLAAAAIRVSGIQARAMPAETEEAFLKGRTSTRGGECLPCPATLGAFLEAAEREGGGPGKHALFMPTASGPCRFGQYCTLDRLLLDERGWDPVHVVSWSSSNNYDGLDAAGRRRMWTGLVLGDLLFKLRCRVTPYERHAGDAELAFSRWTERLAAAIEGGEPLEPLVEAAHEHFAAIPRRPGRKPLVGIVGEIYVRANRFTNQDVVRCIERAGGEAWLAPITEWVLYIGLLDRRGMGNSKAGFKARLGAILRNGFLARDEARWMKLASPLLDERHEPPLAETIAAGERYVPLDFVGETILTLGRAVTFMEQGADLVVNCAPFGCMPGAITSGVLQRIEAEEGVPVANMFYDGEAGGANGRIETYLANLGGG